VIAAVVPGRAAAPRGAPADLRGWQHLDVPFEVGDGVELVVRDVLEGQEGDAVAVADLVRGGGLHVLAERAVASVEHIDPLVELGPDVGRGDDARLDLARSVRDLGRPAEGNRPGIGRPTDGGGRGELD